MMNPETIERTQKFLFASEQEMDAEHFKPATKERLLRLRDIYMFWLNNPRMGSKSVVTEIKRRYKISEVCAWEDLRLIKICLGNLNTATTDYYRWVFLARCEEGFELARRNNDSNAFAKVLAAFGKYTKLDVNDAEGPDYSQIVPMTFEISADPTVAGFKAIPDIEKKAKKLLDKYKKEIDDANFEIVEEIQPLKPEQND